MVLIRRVVRCGFTRRAVRCCVIQLPASRKGRDGECVLPVSSNSTDNSPTPAPAPHLAHPERCAALRIVLVTVPRVSRSCEHHPDGFNRHLIRNTDPNQRAGTRVEEGHERDGESVLHPPRLFQLHVEATQGQILYQSPTDATSGRQHLNQI